LIRQIRRLTRPVPALGNGALAVAVYAQPTHAGMHEWPAAEQGFEGVACVDDAARAAVLYTTLWQRHRLPWARDTALGPSSTSSLCRGRDDEPRWAKRFQSRPCLSFRNSIEVRFSRWSRRLASRGRGNSKLWRCELRSRPDAQHEAALGEKLRPGLYSRLWVTRGRTVRSLTKVFQDSPAVQTPPRLLRQLNIVNRCRSLPLDFRSRRCRHCAHH
jgi:hypothetical protein